ncbi:MAG: ATP-binding protein [Pseudomonadota bacterium]
MNRTWAAIAAAMLAVGVLVVLIYASRPLGAAAYQQHYADINAIENAVGTYNGLLEQLRSPQRDGDASAMDGPRARFEQQTRAVVARTRDEALLAEARAAFSSAADKAVQRAADIESRRTGYQAALQTVREQGPAAVQQLRETGEGDASQRFFGLMLRVLDYGRSASGDPDALLDQIQSISFVDGAAPLWLLDVTSAMNTVVTARTPVGEEVQTVEQSGFASASAALMDALRSTHAADVRSRNDARVLVSVYSLALFAGLGWLGVRLNRSYAEVNEANAQLAKANEDLEARVAARTAEVHSAYDELKDSQVQLVQAEKMSSLGQLVAGISHEINTPLLYLQSNTTLNKETLARVEAFIDLCHRRLVPTRRQDETTEAARRRFVEGLKELQKALVEGEIRDELKEVLLLTDDNLEGLEELTVLAQGLKDFSRLDRAPVDTYDLNDGVERTLVIAKNMLKTRVQVHTELAELPPITCAPSQVNQVLLNLITNASQAIAGTGAITIRTGVADDMVFAAISDTGSGIDDALMQKIRDPFFTTKDVGSGTGLGLSIADDILAKHGGHLDIESELGVGSTFTLYLPVAHTAEAIEAAFGDSVYTPADTMESVASSDEDTLALAVAGD